MDKKSYFSGFLSFLQGDPMKRNLPKTKEKRFNETGVFQRTQERWVADEMEGCADDRSARGL